MDGESNPALGTRLRMRRLVIHSGSTFCAGACASVPDGIDRTSAARLVALGAAEWVDPPPAADPAPESEAPPQAAPAAKKQGRKTG